MFGTGGGTTLIVSADAGLGKTTLIKKFISDNYEDSERKIISGYGYCINMNGSTRSYFPWIESIIELDTNLLTLNYLHGSVEKSNDYKKIIKTAFDGTGTDWIKSIPQIGNISALIYKTIKDLKKGFDVQEASKEIKKISEGISFNNTNDLFAAITVKLRSLSEKYPIIIFIDDLQWMDISSRDLFFYLSKSIKDNPFPLLLIGAYNTDELYENDNEEKENRVNGHLKELISNLKKFRSAEFITVNPFDSKQFNDYINKTYPSNKFADKFLKRIDDITDGNIFFLKQTLDNLEEESIIYKESGLFLNKDVDEYYRLPATINDAILEKWEKLPDEQRNHIKYYFINYSS